MPKVAPNRPDIPGALAELDEDTRSKIMSVLERFGTVTFAMLALGPALAMLNSDLPLHECVELGENPKVREIAERAILFAVLKLANGEDADWQERTLVALWAQQRLAKHPNWHKHKRSGAPRSVKAVALFRAYQEKIEKEPTRKRESIVSELQQEFGLKRRRVLDIIEKMDRRA